MASIDLDTLRRTARACGFEWTDAEIEPIRRAVEQTLEGLTRLETLPLGATEPATQYRVL